MTRLGICAAVVGVALVAAGCGSSSSRSPSGSATFTVKWPDRSRLIPAAANSIKVEISQGTREIAARTVDRPADGGESTVNFSVLPLGTLTATATAYPQAGATGTPQARASSIFEVRAGQQTTVTLDLVSTIARLDVGPPNAAVAVGETIQLVVTPRNEAGEVVLASTNKLHWVTGNANIATVAEDGKARGVSVGSTTITVTETESGKSASIELAVSPGVLPEATFPTSLHATGRGKSTWWAAANGGFENYAHMAYEQLSCKSCHQPRCENCHNAPGDQVSQDKCLGCHGRQKAEMAGPSAYSDVHRDRGMLCMNCHTRREMHGDGTAYASMLAPGAMDARCENAGCHPSLSSNTAHNVHASKVDCSACHTQSVVTCYNCHFESEVNEGKKVPYRQFKDWTFLVNRNGKVTTANFQSVKYQNSTFVAMAPFYAHTVSRQGRPCADCHGSAALQQYRQTGHVDVVKWNAETGQLEPVRGVVPVVPDYKTALRFDFVDLVNGQWQFLKSGADDIQLMFGQPLTTEQLNKLAQ